MIVDSAVRSFSCFQSLLSLPHVFLQRSFVYQINIRKVALHIEASYVTDRVHISMLDNFHFIINKSIDRKQVSVVTNIVVIYILGYQLVICHDKR